jgi:hypothetical protein
MAKATLRIAPETTLAGKSQPETVSIPLGELIRVLRDCVDSNRCWVDDFAHDPVEISRDLYQVLAAYRQMIRAA